MSGARVYLTSGRFVDVPDNTVAGVVEIIDGTDTQWVFFTDHEGRLTRAVHVDAVEAVIAL